MTGRFVKFSGYAIFILSALFLAQRFSSNIEGLLAVEFDNSFYFALISACISYGTIQLFIVAGLCVVLLGFGANNVTFLRILNFHGRTNIAKYIPGNVFHFAGRQILAASFGWPQTIVGLTSIAETILVALGAGLAAMLFAAIAEPDALQIFEKLVSPMIFLGVGIGIAAIWIISTQASRIVFFSRFASSLAIQKFARSVYPPIVVLLYLLFFLSGGLICWFLSSSLSDNWQAQRIAVTGFAYVASWLAGYISPGAPGGIGVREAALVLLLGNTIGETEALLLGVALRVVTTFGDFFLLALALMCRPKMQAPDIG
jgi:hypothetical protein